MKTSLIKPTSLLPTEHIDEERLKVVQEKILKDGVWVDPIRVEHNDLIVMDGHHRLQAALQIGLRYVPIIFFSYEEVSVTSRRSEFNVSPAQVRERGKAGMLYPFKTTNHDFGNINISCSYSLHQLY